LTLIETEYRLTRIRSTLTCYSQKRFRNIIYFRSLSFLLLNDYKQQHGHRPTSNCATLCLYNCLSTFTTQGVRPQGAIETTHSIHYPCVLAGVAWLSCPRLYSALASAPLSPLVRRSVQKLQGLSN